MATLTVNLSTALQTTLNVQNVYAWLAYFNGDTGAYIDSYELAGWNGTSQIVTASTPVTVAEPLNGGKFYLIVQSVDPGAVTPIAPLTFGSGNTIAQESDINWGNATSLDFRYDSFEASLLGLAGDAGNLTDVNGFGIPMSVSITYPNGATTQTRGYNISGSSVFTDISNVSSSLVYTYTQGPLAGDNRMAASPATAVSSSLPGPSANDWNGYVQSLGANGASDIQIAGYFNGAPSVEWTTYNGQNYSYLEYHNPGFYSYTLSYLPGTGTAGTYVFTPTSNSQIQGTISISTADLANSIYSTLGNATVSSPDGTQYQFSSLNNSGDVVVGPDMNTGANNQWGAFFVKLLTGFIGGYLGGTATQQNSLVSGTIDLSKTWNFDPTYAFGGSITAGNPGAVTPWSWSQATYGSGVSFDPYAEIFFSNTNSYGNGYSDALMSLFQQGGPLIPTGYSDTLAANPFQSFGGVLGANPFSVTNGSNVITVTDPNAPSYAVVGLPVTFAGAAAFANFSAANLNTTFTITGVSGTTYTVTAGVTSNATTTGGGTAVQGPSNIVTVTDSDAGAYSVGDLVTFTGAGSVSGANVNGTFAIAALVDGSHYVIQPAGATNATAAGGGSGVVYQKNVTDITLTLFDDSETPTGYTQTEIYDTSPGPFVQPLTSTGASNLSLVLDFGLGQMRPDPSSTITVGFYSGLTTGGAATFSSVTIPSSTSETPYQTWVYGSGAFTAGGAPSPAGSIVQLNGLPYATGVNWYQIEISNAAGTTSRTYNLYANAVAGTGLLNPYYNQGGVNQAGSLALDGLAQIPAATLPATQQYTTSLNIAAFNGGTLSMDPSLLSLITDFSVISAGSNSATWPAPLTPVLGTLDGTTFSNWGGSTNLNTPNTGLNNVTSGELAIGWMGSDMTWVGYNASQSVNVIGSYTNKVSGLDVAQLVFTATSGTAPAPITATADIDGKWTTAATQFGNGTYSAVMSEYLPTDTAFATPVNNPSAALNFTVNIAQLAFKNIGGSFIELDGSSGAAGGNWIRFQTTSSTMPNGTLLAYATDANGNLIGRDGETGPGVTLDEAVLARIGMVATDGGTMLFSGAQSLYLKVGQQLHFAVQTGDGVVQQVPNVQVTGSADALAVKVNGTFGRLDLAATVDNTLSSAATLAGSQRQSDDPWIYLTQGQQTHVEVAGSAQNVNTIHFVQIDVNAATGAWSVGGVGYGNTDAFRSAVQANWDPGFGLTNGGGNFSVATNWAASSGPGYYAPVLVTQSGDIFVIGSANVDGRDHIRMYGENMFGFEDLRADQRADFDYNDLVMKLTLST